MTESFLDLDNQHGALGETHREIGDINLAYMLLAQKLVKQDKASAMFRLGITQDLADLLSGMSLSQIVKLAASNMLLCTFRIESAPMLAVATEEKASGLQTAHMSILMAARQVQATAVYA